MSAISIERRHGLSHKKALEAADKIARDLQARFQLEYGWIGDHVHFQRPGISGRMHVGKDSLTLDVKLGILLMALKPAIEREIRLQLDKLLGKP